jgi:hypothetical protein
MSNVTYHNTDLVWNFCRGHKDSLLNGERNDGQAKEKANKEKETEECNKRPQMWLVWENEQLDKDRML